MSELSKGQSAMTTSPTAAYLKAVYGVGPDLLEAVKRYVSKRKTDDSLREADDIMPYFGGNDCQYPCTRCGQPVSNRGIAQASHRRKHLREFREEYVKTCPYPDAGTDDAKDRWERACEYAFRNAGPPI